MTRYIKQSEFAKVIGVSGTRVGQMKSEGILPADLFNSDSKIDQTEGILTYCKHLRDIASGRKVQADDGEQLDPVVEKAKLTREQAEKTAHEKRLKEIAVKKAEGSIIEVDSVEQVLATIIGHAKSRLEALPTRLVNDVPGLTKSDLSTVESIIHEVLTTMATDAPDLMQDAVDQEIEKYA